MSCRRWAGDGFICRAKVAVGLGPPSRLFGSALPLQLLAQGFDLVGDCISCCWRATWSMVAQFIVELAEETFLEPVHYGRTWWLCCVVA